MRQHVEMVPMARAGQCVLVAYGSAILHITDMIEAIYLEGFSAAQLMAPSASDAWADSRAKMVAEAEDRVGRMAIELGSDQ